MINYYTPVKAKEKMCPIINGCCIAAGCMAWRWLTEPDLTEEDKEHIIVAANPARVVRVKNVRGYCGLVGKGN